MSERLAEQPSDADFVISFTTRATPSSAIPRHACPTSSRTYFSSATPFCFR